MTSTQCEAWGTFCHPASHVDDMRNGNTIYFPFDGMIKTWQ
jgi:hypothetical protein